jgi:hypothetical protein
MIINAGESCWRVPADGLQTWAPTGAQNVHFDVVGDEKESFTVVAAVTAARTKLPLSLIAASKTAVVEKSHFGDIGDRRTDHSESGWTSTGTFQRWRAWLRGGYDDGQPLWLILDCYPVHRQEDMKDDTSKLGIHLPFIPPGLTDELQPLDHFVFGVMKANCSRMYRIQVAMTK